MNTELRTRIAHRIYSKMGHGSAPCEAEYFQQSQHPTERLCWQLPDALLNEIDEFLMDYHGCTLSDRVPEIEEGYEEG